MLRFHIGVVDGAVSLGQLTSSDQPDDRLHPTRPWVGVGVVVWRDQQVLLVRRGRPPRLGAWSIPGGAQRVGETVAEAARREVLEETGLTVAITGLISVEDAITPDTDGGVLYHYTLVEFRARWVSGEAVAADDASAVMWVDWREAARWSRHADTLRVIEMSAGMEE